MWITLELDDDVLEAARELVHRPGLTVSQVISELARDGLHRSTAAPDQEPASFFGFTPLPAAGVSVTIELINVLREESLD